MSWLRHIRFSGVPERATRRLASIVLGGLSLALFFGGLVGRQLELSGGTDTRWANVQLGGGTALAVLAIVAAGSLRRPWGLTLGWVVLALTALSTLVLAPMGIVTVIFGALWLLALVQGPSMEQLTRDWIAEHGPVHPDERDHPHIHPDHGAPLDRAHGVARNDPTERTGESTTHPTERTGESTTHPTERMAETRLQPTERTDREDST